MRAAASGLSAGVCVVLELATATAFAGFSGSDLFLPMAGRPAGVFPSSWYTDVRIHDPGPDAAVARIFLLERGTSNPSPPFADVVVGPGETEKLWNSVETLFHRSAESTFRFNFGFVETTGHTVTVRVTALDRSDATQGFKDSQVREYSQRQVAFKDHFPTVSTENTRLEVEVISGSGAVIAYGSGVANGSQDPTTFEMDYPARVLAESASAGITGVVAGFGLSGGGSAGTVTVDVGVSGDGPGGAIGVLGESSSGSGVLGSSSTGPGVRGTSSSGYGVQGHSNSVANSGVWGNNNNGGPGMLGTSGSTGPASREQAAASPACWVTASAVMACVARARPATVLSGEAAGGAPMVPSEGGPPGDTWEATASACTGTRVRTRPAVATP